jgi:hypothetical protein
MLLTTRSRSVKQILRQRDEAQRTIRDNIKRQVSPHRPLSEALADGAWAGEPAFIIGGGPSLVGFDFERLRGRGRVIVINRAFEFVPWADLLFFMDHRFYKMCHDEPAKREKWEAFGGMKVFLNLMGRKLDDCYSVRSLGRRGVSWSIAKGLYHGNNSGHGALNLALALRARPIYLLGYDMTRDPKGRSHFHSGYGMKSRPGVSQSFVAEFREMAKKIPNVDWIYNLNPASGLRCFKFRSVEEALNGQAGKSLGDDASALRLGPLLGPSPAD